jgi:peptidoglycan hydrolase-like protein with peptidoglycan-binding domain
MTTQLLVTAEPFGELELESEYGRRSRGRGWGGSSSRTQWRGQTALQRRGQRASQWRQMQYPTAYPQSGIPPATAAYPRRQWPDGSSYSSPNIAGWAGRRRPWWYGRTQYQYVGSGAAGDWITWAQQCLRTVIGPWVPQSGKMSKATRRAIRMFQKRSRLPATGLFDGATERALRNACGGQRAPIVDAGAPPPTAAPPEPPPPPPDVAPPEQPPADTGADAAPPDAGAGDAPADSGGSEPDAPPADGGDSELAGELQQEFLVAGACQVRIQRHGPVPLTDEAALRQAARAPGVYIISIDGKPWYVGVAERTVLARIQERRKVLRDFNIPSSTLANRSISWVAIRSGALPVCAVSRRKQTDPDGQFRPLKGVYAVLKVLEQYYIKTLGTENKGNKLLETVRFSPGGSVTILESRKSPVRLDQDSPI